MGNPIADIHDYDVANLVNKLVAFLGRPRVEKCLDRYQRSLQSSGPVFREYYLKDRHPWWNGLTRYFELQKAGKSIRKNLTKELMVLAGDAKKVTTLQKLMPASIKRKYRADLLDDERAYDYLFEIQIAWHFFLKGCVIQWHEDGSGSHSEFLVKAPDFDFNVECKRISVDASRRIRRRDFYRLAEKLVKEVNKENLFGTVEIVLNDRLHGNEKHLAVLASQVAEIIRSGQVTGNHQIHFGDIFFNLNVTNGTEVDLTQRLTDLLQRNSHQAHFAIFARAKNRKAVDPVELTLKSKKADNLLAAIERRIYKAAKDQLSNSKPGMIICFLEGIHDLEELATNSGLQIMTNHLLDKDELSHVAAVSYCSETRVGKSMNIETFSNQGLIFRNPRCRFEKAKDYQFLTKEADSL